MVAKAAAAFLHSPGKVAELLQLLYIVIYLMNLSIFPLQTSQNNRYNVSPL